MSADEAHSLWKHVRYPCLLTIHNGLVRICAVLTVKNCQVRSVSVWIQDVHGVLYAAILIGHSSA